MSEPQFLLDTNILVYLIAGSSVPLRSRVEAFEPGSLVTSTLCVAEALYGTAGRGEDVTFDALLAIVEPQPFDLRAARMFPRIPFRRGRLDRFIAAHTLALDLVLVTNNERDFVDIPDLQIENWTV